MDSFLGQYVSDGASKTQEQPPMGFGGYQDHELQRTNHAHNGLKQVMSREIIWIPRTAGFQLPEQSGIDLAPMP
ncbi:hypothetical protein DSO57_1029130 [Entomophthora muscae]|uniref:Uncharacterized protein n=1 Tax=Entomophthora muscae TaxID=34485 RepID=A0ACC2U0C4_9FUNG|nr:hypothetical protein DSO57_1029130 [Entomophthora muscae]